MADLEQHPGPALVTGPLDTDERAELERLRQEVAALRTAPPPPPARPPRQFRWASLGSAVLLVLGLLLVPVSVLAVWTNNQVSNTDRFVATVSPIAADPAVQTAIADRVTAEIFNRLDVQALANQGVDALAAQGLPPPVVERLHDLTGPVAEGVRNFVRGKVGEVVASPRFVAAVNQAVTVAHTQMEAALSGDSAAITVSGGNAVLDLAPFIDAAKQELVASGFAAAGRIPEIHPTIELFPASTLIRLQTAYRTLDAVATWLPWLTLVLLVGGVLLARRRRRATMAVGIAVMAIMVLLAASLLVVRGIVVGGVPEQGVAAVAAAYDIVVRFVRIALRTLFVVGLVVALAAYLTGPSRGAVAIRRTVSGWIGWLRRGGIAERLQNGPVGPWVHAYRRALQVTAVILAALVVIFLDRPTGFDILWVVIGLLVVLGVIEFLNQPRESEEPRAGPPADDSGAVVGGTG